MRWNWCAKWFVYKTPKNIRHQWEIYIAYKRLCINNLMSNRECWYWYKAQVVHQSFWLHLCILCFTPQWQEWLALSQTCVLEVQECPVNMPFRLLKRTWRLINTCNLHTKPCVQVRLLKSCQAYTRIESWGKGGTLIKAPQTWNYFFPPRAFYNLGSAVRPSCLFEL